MYAVTITKPGGPEVLAWTEVPDPIPGPNEVLIDVAASAVNRADLLQRAGFYPPPPGASPYPGLECSGVIAHPAGPWNRGDEVCALLAGGGYAQKVAVPVGQVLPKPANLTLEEAAALPEVAATVWSNIFQLAGLTEGEILLIHGGGSGIGTFAIQLAKAYGATVITTARKAKHQALQALGADVTIDYEDDDFVQAVGKGANVILDIMGGAYLARNIEALAPNGRLAIIGLQGGRSAELDLGALMAKRGTVHCTALRARPTAEKEEIIHAVRTHVWPLVESGRIKPVIDGRFPMASAAQAHELVATNDHVGKVLLIAPSNT